MRIVFIGGTGPIGEATSALAMERGDDFVVAHSGAHEGADGLVAEHLHGSREVLLAPGGLVEGARPDVLVDSFFASPNPGATADKAREFVAVAQRAGANRLIAISSTDVYRYCIEAGLDGGYGLTLLPSDPVPLTEDSPLRRAHPNSDDHDNVLMEEALQAARFDGTITILRLGMVYGPFPHTREAELVRKVQRHERRLELPGRGNQFFARVAVERVARAVLASCHRADPGAWPCNVVDPYGWTYAGLAAEIGRILDWTWDPVETPFQPPDAPHPFAVASPCLFDDRRLREHLCVTEPDPRTALEDLTQWLYEHLPVAMD